MAKGKIARRNKMAFDFYSIVQGWEEIGFYDVALPFLLVFVLAYGVFLNIKLFGDANKPISLVVSLLLAFLAVRTNLVLGLINSFLPRMSILLIIFLMTLLILGVFGLHPGEKGWPVWAKGIAAVVALAAVFWALVAVGVENWGLPFNFPVLDSKNASWFIVLGIFVLVVASVFWGESKPKPSSKPRIPEGGE